MSSKITKQHIPCNSPLCDSSDGMCEYDDGHTYCFACQTYTPSTGSAYKLKTYHQFSKEWRGLTSKTLQHFNIKTETDEQGRPLKEHFFHEKHPTKIRNRQHSPKWTQDTSTRKATPGLYYSDLFNAGSSSSITIVEGIVDAPSVWQMLGSKWPVVAVQSSSTARRDCAAERAFLDSFDKLYICMDNDEAGQRATEEIVSLFNPKKCFIVPLSKRKDANEYLAHGEKDEFVRIWWNSQPYNPANIISSFDSIKQLFKERVDKPALPYPFPKLQEMTYGMRGGEVHLVTALEGIGKTEIIRNVEHSLLRNSDLNIGIVHVEEDVPRCVEGLVGLDIGKPCHIPELKVFSDDEVNEHYANVLCNGVDNRVNFYNHFGSEDDEKILNDIRFMAASNNCKVIFLDHISILVSGNTDDKERIRLDNLSTQLAMLAKELDFTLVMVSHVNDDLRTRGSRNISKVANVWYHLDRDPEAEHELLRNMTTIRVKKNRYGATTGIADKLIFDKDQFTLAPITTAQQVELSQIQQSLESQRERLPF